MNIRVEFIPDKSNPPPVRINDPEARSRNRAARTEVREIVKIIKIGQSFKVWGLEYAKVSTLVHGVLKDPRKGSNQISVTARDMGSFTQVWRSA